MQEIERKTVKSQATSDSIQETCIHIQPKHATKQPTDTKVSVALSVWSVTFDN